VKQSLYANTLRVFFGLAPNNVTARMFTYNELYSGRLVARTPAFQVGEAGSKPVRSTKNAQHRFMLWRDSLCIICIMLLKPQLEFFLQEEHSTNLCRCSPLGRAPDCLSDLGGFDSRRRRQVYGCVGKLVTPEDCKSSARKALLVRIQRHPPNLLR